MSTITLDTNLKYLSHLSNAVLTPHLIHPDFWKMDKRPGTRSDYAAKPMPLSKNELIERKRWCKAQLIALERNPSNAVLGVTL